MNANFYDIESLANVFTLANYDEKHNHIDIYYIIDTPELKESLFKAFRQIEPNGINRVSNWIYKNNQNFNGNIAYLDLTQQESMKKLCATFGCSDSRCINNPALKNNFAYMENGKDIFRLICDTDPEYQENPDAYPYLMGYNSFNYDTTMTALLFKESIRIYQQNTTCQVGQHLDEPQMVHFQTTTAKRMREHNDMLFSSRYKKNMPSYLSSGKERYQSIQNIIRKNMMMSGRHLDVARLNEKQSKVALKRLLGMLGYQIMESDKLKPKQNTIKTIDELLDLIAYNVSDIVNLRMLFYHKFYQAQFELKHGLLQTYPELVYEQDGNNYKPKISQTTVRRDRLNIDASSAQFATKCLCPYGHLKDIPTVSFDYPAKEKADELGIKQVNVLDEAKKFFDNLYPGPQHAAIRAKFQRIYDYYKSLEGKNFNDSSYYAEDFDRGDGTVDFPSYKLKDMPKLTDEGGTFLPYYDKNGKPTSCYVIFSTGGVHGAEYNKKLYDADIIDYEARKKRMAEAKALYPNPVDLRKAKKITLSDGKIYEYKEFLQSGKKIAESAYRETIEKPELSCINNKGMTELNKRYTYTSSDAANHEDFTSYYPNLLRMMRAFFNEGLGYDRYAEIFQQKEDYGKLMKDKSLPEKEREHYRILREGTKLILNSASGAADALFENNIRVNNQIISMRIIGQLFSWRIGQAQSAQGAKVISTNTDGLYSVMEETLNNKILEKESADIGVAIEPEPMFLISKDTNNRIELTGANGKIIGASGGTLGCRKGPNPTKALAHPAILDWALAEYLIVAASGYKGLSLDDDFNEEIGKNILMKSKTAFKPLDFMLMYQNIVSSSPSSINYVYGLTDANPNDAIVLQHYNRMFIVKDNTPDTMHLWASCARKVTPAALQKRKRDGTRNIYEPLAMYVLETNGVDTEEIKSNTSEVRDIVSKKVTNIEPEWYVKLMNYDLHAVSEKEFHELMDNLDYEKYLSKLKESYENSWRNHIPAAQNKAA